MPSASPEPDYSDPGYFRHCLRPDCTASFNIAEQMTSGPYVHGWHLVKMFAHGYICPQHSGPIADGNHVPGWIWRDAPDEHRVAGVKCTCGQWSWEPGQPVTNGECQEQWTAHLIQIDP